MDQDAELPHGLSVCASCGEPCGTSTIHAPATGRHVAIESTCACASVPCRWCDQNAIRRPASQRFDLDAGLWVHSPPWVDQLPCESCRGEGIGTDGVADDGEVLYELWATPFRGEAPRDAEYFRSSRFLKFLESLPVIAARSSVELADLPRNIFAVWRGNTEPAVKLVVLARGNRLRDFAAQLCLRWNQEAVIVFASAVPGTAIRHRGLLNSRSGVSAPEAMADRRLHDLPCVAVTPDGWISVIDLVGASSPEVDRLLSGIGFSGARQSASGFLVTAPRPAERPGALRKRFNSLVRAG